MSYPITNEDVASLLDAIGRPVAADTVRHFEQPTPPVAWVAEIVDLEDRLEAHRDQLGELETLLCTKCKANWEKASA